MSVDAPAVDVVVVLRGLDAGVTTVLADTAAALADGAAADRASPPIPDCPVAGTPAVPLALGVEGVRETGATTVLLLDDAGAAAPTAAELVAPERCGSVAATPAPLGVAVTLAVEGWTELVAGCCWAPEAA